MANTFLAFIIILILLSLVQAWHNMWQQTADINREKVYQIFFNPLTSDICSNINQGSCCSPLFYPCFCSILVTLPARNSAEWRVMHTLAKKPFSPQKWVTAFRQKDAPPLLPSSSLLGVFSPYDFFPSFFFLSPAGENRLPTLSTVRRESGVSSEKGKRRGGGGGRAGISPLLPGFFCLPRGLGMEVSIVVNSSSSFRRASFFNKKTWQYFSFVGIFFIPDVLFELSPKGRL